MSPSPLRTVKPCVKTCHDVLAKPELTGKGIGENDTSRRACGCRRTSEKLRDILKTFPQPPPPSPTSCKVCKDIVHISSLGVMSPDRIVSVTLNGRQTYNAAMPTIFMPDISEMQTVQNYDSKKQLQSIESSVQKDTVVNTPSNKPFWIIVKELISLIHVSVTATALAVYYLIYCYMQLIYYTLRSAVYFHQADASMKITITIVTVTGLIFSFYCIMRLDNLVGVHLRHFLHFKFT